MPESPTANMLLVLPTEGSDSGSWDTIINTAGALIDAHDHSTGKGVKVKTNGIDVNADLTFTSSGTAYAAKDLKAVDFAPVAASSMTAYAGAFFVNSDDSNNLYFRTVAGSNVKVTSGAALNVGAFTGGFGGDYGAIPAEANFVDADKEYTFKSTAAGNWSRLRAGAMRIAEFGTTEATYVELACPAALAGTYTITMPTAAPGSTSLVAMSSAGVLSASNTIANAVTMSSTLEVTGLITATAGVTAAVNQHVTVSGSGDHKHGDKTGFLHPSLGVSIGASTAQMDGNADVQLGASASWFVGLPSRSGVRIKTVAFQYTRSSGTTTFEFYRRTLSTGTLTLITSTTITAGTSYATATISPSYTLLTTESYHFKIVTSAASGGALHDITYVYDIP